MSHVELAGHVGRWHADDKRLAGRVAIGLEIAVGLPPRVQLLLADGGLEGLGELSALARGNGRLCRAHAKWSMP